MNWRWVLDSERRKQIFESLWMVLIAILFFFIGFAARGLFE